MLPVGSRSALSPAAQRRDPHLVLVIAVAALLLLTVQWVSGAWTAEFDGYPDEAAQFISGRMLWEYLHDLPVGSPIQWAGQYYLHYPKVAIGHWPPGYPMIEAGWSLAFGSSRRSAMALQWLTGVAAIAGIYLLVRPRFSLPVALMMLLAVVAAPVFQQGLSLVMADLACLLASVLFMHAMMGLLKNPDRWSILPLCGTLFAAAMIKGTAICLFPVPLLALAVCGRRVPLRPWWAIAGGLSFVAICAAWYGFSTNIVYWGGITGSIPWPIANLGRLIGWGFIALAFLGLRREPLAILAACMIGSAVVVSFFVRAMNEPRHWIAVLPAILILDAYAVSSIPRRYLPFVLAAALALFPYGWYRQKPTGYAALVRQLRLPGRILISGSSGDEGACIAETAIAEHYPGSMVVRATKALMASGWNGENYRLTATTPGEVSQRLDELAIDTVVVAMADRPRRPDEVLLASMLHNSPVWRQCASAGTVTAYCRTKPPEAPRKPLVIDVGGFKLEERIAGGP